MATATTTSSETSTTSARTPAPASVIEKNRIQARPRCPPSHQPPNLADFWLSHKCLSGRKLSAHGLEEFFYLKSMQR
jgi:hypothetical protein